MKYPVKSLLSALGFGLIAATPSVFAQTSAPAAPPPPPPAADSSADQTPPPPPKPKRGGRDMLGPVLAKVTNLTDDENTKIDAIKADTKDKAKAIREDDTLSGDDKRAKSADLMKSTIAQIRAVLTADQQTQLDAAVASMKKHGGKKKSEDADATPPPPAAAPAPAAASGN